MALSYLDSFVPFIGMAPNDYMYILAHNQLKLYSVHIELALHLRGPTQREQRYANGTFTSVLGMPKRV